MLYQRLKRTETLILNKIFCQDAHNTTTHVMGEDKIIAEEKLHHFFTTATKNA